jgi:hypothetical protein
LAILEYRDAKYRGIVHSEDHGSAFVGQTMVKTGAIIDGIKVVNISAAAIEFEKNGHRRTQKIGQAPSEQYSIIRIIRFVKSLRNSIHKQKSAKSVQSVSKTKKQ